LNFLVSLGELKLKLCVEVGRFETFDDVSKLEHEDFVVSSRVLSNTTERRSSIGQELS